MNIKKFPISDVLMLAGALGYFILPVDVIPDGIPGLGFTDDAAALSFAFKKAIDLFSNDSINMARNKSREIFGDNFDEEKMIGMVLQAKKKKK